MALDSVEPLKRQNRELLDKMKESVYPKYAKAEAELNRQYQHHLQRMSDAAKVGEWKLFDDAVKARKSVDVALAQMESQRYHDCVNFCREHETKAKKL